MDISTPGSNEVIFVRKRNIRFVVLVVTLILAVGVVLENRHAKIDEWSSSLTIEKIDWAEVSREYGTEKISYVLSEEDYTQLLPLLRSVKESICSRRESYRRMEEGYRLALFYEEKLWLLKCCQQEVVSLMFEDAETGAYYGCEGKLLYIHSPELWRYIVDTVEKKAV